MVLPSPFSWPCPGVGTYLKGGEDLVGPGPEVVADGWVGAGCAEVDGAITQG
jgi:hypothetical protein